MRQRFRSCGFVAVGVLLLGTAMVDASPPAGAISAHLPATSHGWAIQADYPEPITSLDAVACPTTSHCWAISQPLTGPPTVVATTDGGSTWTAETLPSGVRLLEAVSCASTSDCWVPALLSSDAVSMLATTDGGGTWTEQTLPSGISNLAAISCVSTSDCSAVGASGSSAVVVATTDGGSIWSPPTSLGSYALTGISCPSKSDCWATGNSNVVVDTTNAWSTWTIESLPKVGFVEGLNGISCASSSDCRVVGQFEPTRVGHPFGLVFASSDGGSTWKRQTLPSTQGVQASVVETLSGVSCASTLDCWAVGNDYAGGGEVVVTTDGGRTWTAQTRLSVMGDLSGIACASVSACTAVGYNVTPQQSNPGPFGPNVGAVVATTDGGDTWASQDLPGVIYELAGLSCPSTSHCWAVGYDEAGAVVVATTDGGLTWTM